MTVLESGKGNKFKTNSRCSFENNRCTYNSCNFSQQPMLLQFWKYQSKANSNHLSSQPEFFSFLLIFALSFSCHVYLLFCQRICKPCVQKQAPCFITVHVYNEAFWLLTEVYFKTLGNDDKYLTVCLHNAKIVSRWWLRSTSTLVYFSSVHIQSILCSTRSSCGFPLHHLFISEI